MTHSRRQAVALLLATGLMNTAAPAAAQSPAPAWPERPVRIINPYAPGGPSDTLVRMLAEGLTAELGQRVFVENKPGGGTVIGAALVAKAPPDGHTLLLATVAPLVIQPLINPALPYDARKDFTLVSMYATVPNLVAVHADVPVDDLQGLIALARRQPGRLSFASAGMGTGPHLGGEQFARLAGIQWTHVPYGGAAPAVQGVLGGQVPVSFVNITPQLPHVKAGKLKPLAVGGTRRVKALPQVPTLAEAGLPGLVSESWNGLAVPAGTPRAVVDRLAQAVAKIMAGPSAQALVDGLGGDATVLGPKAFADYVAADERQLGPLVKSLALTPN